MLKKTQSVVINAGEVEIAKAKSRLDAVYADTEILKKDRTAIEVNIIALQKHVNYLEDVVKQRDAEIVRKETAIKGLDKQLEDKQRAVNLLQKTESDVNASLESKREQIQAAEEKVRLHNERMAKESELSSKKLKEAHEKHECSHEKLEKIKALIDSIK